METGHNIRELHGLLSVAVNPEEITISTRTDEKGNRSATINGVNCALPNHLNDAELVKMLTGHPANVTINDEPVPSDDPPTEPSVTRWGGSRAAPKTVHISGPPTGQWIQLDGVRYRLENVQEPEIPALEYLIVHNPKPRETDQPQFVLDTIFLIQHNLAAESNDAVPDLVWHNQSARCRPDRTMAMNLQAQVDMSRQRALSAVGSTASHAEFVGGHESSVNKARHNLWTPREHHRPISITELGKPAVMDQELPSSTAYAIARALTTTDHDGWVPILQKPNDGTALPTIRFIAVKVTRQDGEIITITAKEIADHLDQPGLRPLPGERALEIELHILIGFPGDEEAAVHMTVPTDLYTGGRCYDEVIWTRQDNRDDEDQLQQDLFNAYWHDRHNPIRDMEREADDYDAHCITAAIRIARGEEAAFRGEVQRMANRFYPQSKPAGTPVRHRSGDRHIVTWQPVAHNMPGANPLVDSAEAIVFGEIIRNMYHEATNERMAEILSRCLDRYAAMPELRQAMEEIAKQACLNDHDSQQPEQLQTSAPEPRA